MLRNKNKDHRLLSDGTKRSGMRVRSDHEVAVGKVRNRYVQQQIATHLKGDVGGLEI